MSIKRIKTEMLSAVQRTYTDSSGANKSIYRNIGELLTFQKDDGSTYQTVELYHMPSVKIGVYEKQDNTANNKKGDNQPENRVDNIPF